MNGRQNIDSENLVRVLTDYFKVMDNYLKDIETAFTAKRAVEKYNQFLNCFYLKNMGTFSYQLTINSSLDWFVFVSTVTDFIILEYKNPSIANLYMLYEKLKEFDSYTVNYEKPTMLKTKLN